MFHPPQKNLEIHIYIIDNAWPYDCLTSLVLRLSLFRSSKMLLRVMEAAVITVAVARHIVISAASNVLSS